jgi:hypothetical protein
LTPAPAAAPPSDFVLPRGNTDSGIASFPAPLPSIGKTAWSPSPDDRYLYCVPVDVPPSDLILVEGFR